MKHYIWLFGISLLALWQMLEFSFWSTNLLSLLVFLPYVIIVFGIFISLFMNRFLPVLILLSLGALNFTVNFYLSDHNFDLATNLSFVMLLPMLTLMLPVNLLLWTLLPERGVRHLSYISLLTTLFFSQGALIYFAMLNLPLHWIESLSRGIDIQWVNIPVYSVLLVIVVWLIMVFKNAYLANIRVIDRVVVFVLLLVSVALNQMHEPYVFSWLITVSAVLVVISIVFDAHQIAYTDQLTGMKARRALMESFLGLGRKYSIAMMDIDHFKKFNDTYGHDVGDDVLVLVANELAAISIGQPYRYGGEEFVVVFPRKSAEQVEDSLEVVRKNIENIKLNLMLKGKKKQPKITVSFGLAEKSARHKNAQAVMKAADKALYVAKESGRNQLAREPL